MLNSCITDIAASQLNITGIDSLTNSNESCIPHIALGCSTHRFSILNWDTLCRLRPQSDRSQTHTIDRVKECSRCSWQKWHHTSGRGVLYSDSSRSCILCTCCWSCISDSPMKWHCRKKSKIHWTSSNPLGSRDNLLQRQSTVGSWHICWNRESMWHLSAAGRTHCTADKQKQRSSARSQAWQHDRVNKWVQSDRNRKRSPCKW